ISLGRRHDEAEQEIGEIEAELGQGRRRLEAADRPVRGDLPSEGKVAEGPFNALVKSLAGDRPKGGDEGEAAVRAQLPEVEGESDAQLDAYGLALACLILDRERAGGDHGVGKGLSRVFARPIVRRPGRRRGLSQNSGRKGDQSDKRKQSGASRWDGAHPDDLPARRA